jgi:hypothetical protein
MVQGQPGQEVFCDTPSQPIKLGYDGTCLPPMGHINMRFSVKKLKAKSLVAGIKWYSGCLTSARPLVQILLLPKNRVKEKVLIR